MRFVVDKRTAPTARTPLNGFYLNYAGAAIAKQLAGPLIAAIRQLDHRQAVVDANHAHLLYRIGIALTGLVTEKYGDGSRGMCS